MSSPIREFYSQKSIFITGATGFVGKVLVEKVLRSCNDIHTIYVLIRPKKGKSTQQRWLEYVSDEIFSMQNLDMTELGKKIVPINGCLSETNLGISDEDRKLLIDNVSVVFHFASYLKYEPPLREAVAYNLMGTMALIQLCRQIKHLDAIVYSSTLALLCRISDPKEIVYPTPVSPEHVIETCQKLTDKQIKKYVKLVFTGYPNIYTVSKAFAEQVLLRESENNMKVAIVRPSMINPSYREPVAGWVSGRHGPTSVALLGTLGIMRIAQFDLHSRPGQVPVDFVSNAIIAAAWYVARKSSNNIEVYHLTTDLNQSPSMLDIHHMLRDNLFEAPSKNLIRPPKLIFFKNKYRIKFQSLFTHWLYAYFIDFLGKWVGFKSRLVEITRIMNATMHLNKFWVNHDNQFGVERTQFLISQMSPIDRQVFYFDIKTIDWKPYYKNIWMGLRKFMLKENEEDIPRAKRRLKRMSINYNFLLLLWYSFIVSLLYCLLLIVLYYFGINLSQYFYFYCPTTIAEHIWFLAIPVCLYIGYKLLIFITINLK